MKKTRLENIQQTPVYNGSMKWVVDIENIFALELPGIVCGCEEK